MYDEIEEISEFWPEDFHEVVYVVGEAGALELVRLLSGIHLRIPARNCEARNDYSWNMLPSRLAEVMFNSFHGDTIYIPTLKRAQDRAQLYAISSLRVVGVSMQETALKLGIVEQKLYRLQKKDVLQRRQKAQDRQNMKLLPAPKSKPIT